MRRKASRCWAPHLFRTSPFHETLLERIPTLSDVQSAWALLLHCANARATYLLRVVRLEMVHRFAEGHDHGLWRCLSTILGLHPEQCDLAASDAATLPLFWEGWGLRSAVRNQDSAFWASWADSLAMIHQRHLEVANSIVVALEDGCDSPVPVCSQQRTQTIGWRGRFRPTLVACSVPVLREPDEFERLAARSIVTCRTGTPREAHSPQIGGQ